MIFYLVSPRLQMICAALVIGFHLNAYLLMGVKYFAPIVAALALSYPWPRILRRIRGAPATKPAPATQPSNAEIAALGDVARRAMGWVVLAAATAVLLWLGLHFNDSAELLFEHPH